MRDPIPWDKVFLDMCFAIAQRSKDDSTQCGAVLIDERRVIISAGFNGPPPQLYDSRIPWDKRPQKYAFIIHAEENAILFGLENRGRVTGSTLYCTHHPCADCVLRIIWAGVREVVIPASHPPYPLSKYQVEPGAIMDCQIHRRLTIREFDYVS